MLLRISADTAVENLKSSDTAHWSVSTRGRPNSRSAATRLAENVLRPELHPRFTFTKKAKVFGMGSCFVREIERALIERGVNVPHPGVALAAKWRHVNPAESGNPWVMAAYANKYNTYSMLYEVQRACLGPAQAPDYLLPVGSNQCVDLYVSNVLADFSEAAVRERRAIIDAHTGHLCDCDVFILTLGLTEGWFHRPRGIHVNLQAGALTPVTRPDFDFVVLDFNEHMTALDELYRIVKTRNPKCRIVVTVSPIPLQATFSGQDIILANTYSKSTLRSVAGAFCAKHDDVDYFPSYEMVMFSNPALVWQTDRRHVKPEIVAQIVDTFTTHYIREEVAP